MKTLMVLISILLITGCLPRSMQPPPKGYESYHSRHPRIKVETIKQDMRECGFPDVYNEAGYFVDDKNGFAQSNICMEKKGYRNIEGRRGVCSSDIFKNTEACQKHLSQTQGKKNQK
ncbi:hypothetical protein [Moraxella marmotae]|uniref:hypothetical protein n=1 Tax=Moraxella marmotae TaxID=3344520 RepID=UPI0035F2EF16